MRTTFTAAGVAAVSTLAMALALAVPRRTAPHAAATPDPAAGANAAASRASTGEARAGDPRTVNPLARPCPPASAPDEAAATEQRTLRATVLSEPDGLPLEGVEVVLLDSGDRRRTRVTDDGGAVVFDDLDPNHADVVAAPPGRDRGWAQADLLHGDATVEFRLARSGRASGRVVDGRDGSALAGATVSLAPVTFDDHGEIAEVGAPRCATSTDGGGAFLLDDVPHGPATCIARAPGFRPAVREFTLAPGTDLAVGLRFRLFPARSIRGVVRDPDGEPASGATVRAEPVGEPLDVRESDGGHWRPSGVRTATADAEGAFLLEDLLAEGTWRVTARAGPWGESEVLEVAPGEGFPEPVTLRLRRAARLTVVVTRPGGEAERGAEVIVDPCGMSWDRPVPADAHGRHVAEVPLPGWHRVRVRVAGYLDHDRWIDVPPESETVLRVNLERPLAVAGVAVDDLGAPIEGVRLVARRVHGGRRRHAGDGSGTSGPDGRFRIEGLGAGRYDVHREVHGIVELPVATGVAAPVDDLRVVAPRAARVRARLVLPPGHGPPERIWLALLVEAEDGARQWVEDGSRGMFWTDGVLDLPTDPEADRRLRIRIPGFLGIEADLATGAGAERDLGDVLLDPGLPLSGRVVDDRGRAVEGATVRAIEDGGAWQEEATGDAEGRFRLEHLPPGGRVLAIEARDHFAVTRAVHVEPAVDPVEIVLPRGAMMRLRVVDEIGRASPRTPVVVRPARGTGGGAAPWIREYRADVRGGVDVRLAAGTYRFDAGEAPFVEEPGLLLTVADGEERFASLTVPRP